MVEYNREREKAPLFVLRGRREIVRKKNLFLIGIFVLVPLWLGLSSARAATIVKDVDFTQPTVTYDQQGSAISVENLPVLANLGEPLLPVYSMQILLPQGEDIASVTVNVPFEEAISIDLPVVLARQELPTSSPAPKAFAIPDPTFDQTQAFPRARAVHVYTGTCRGYNVAFLNIYPVTYMASTGTLFYSPRLEVRIETVPSTVLLSRSLATLRRGRSQDLSTVKKMVGGDVEAVSSYTSYMSQGLLGAHAGLVGPDETYPYIIITDSALEPAFEVLRQHKDQRGLRAKIVLASDIAANYTGADLQTKIRNFIKDAYLNWETEYVLLAGDDDIIPHRGLYAIGPSAIDSDIPSDLYYGALDGSWNDDGDSYWGEPGEADLMPEVSVGRAAVGDTIEAENFVAKVIKYESMPVVSQIKTAQMVGEGLSAGTWGGDYKDEIRYGSSSFGYTTAGFPPSFTVSTLYDRDLYPDVWDKEDLIPLLNSGRHIVNHLGHADVTYCMRMYNTDVETRFTNDGVSNTYFILYSQGCYAGSFDNRNPVGYAEDCFGEHLTFVENAAVAFIGNTRYGWYMPYSTNGSSQHYDRQFFDALFAEGITAIGKANDDSRIDNIPFINVGAMRWVYYDLVLLGDPSMDVWTDEPGYVNVSHPEVIYTSDNQVEITVKNGSSPIQGARVAVFSDSTWVSGCTDSGGKAYLNPLAGGPGSLYLAVTAHDFYAYLDTIPVELANHAVVMIREFTIDDDTLGVSFGNSNGKMDAGETIESCVSLENVGQDSALGVFAVLRIQDSYVMLIDSSGAFGDIAPDSIAAPPWSYAYQVSPSAPDSHRVEFDLAISYADTSFVRRYWASVSAPELVLTGISVADTLTGNGDGCLEAGEGFELALSFKNGGSGDAIGASVVISGGDPYVTIDVDSGYADSIPSGQEVEISPAYVVTISPDCPEFHRIDLGLEVTLTSGRLTTDSTSIYVGGSLVDDMESGSPGWVHHDMNDMHLDQWHVDTYRNHTAGGGQSWKFGGPGSAGYSDFGHAALETPELCLGPNATLTFWHWIHAELYNGQYAWDGGIVEISLDGGRTWSQLTPVGGYDRKIYPNYFSPFPGNTPCFAWTNDWTQVQIDLASYQGRAKIRFRFGSDQYYAEEGWYIDDISISDDYASVTIPDKDLKVAPARFALTSIDPNPVSSEFTITFDVPRVSRVAIEVFDVTGRALVGIANSVLGPGRYSRSFDCGPSLAPGVYFVSMRAEGFNQTRKLIVVK